MKSMGTGADNPVARARRTLRRELKAVRRSIPPDARARAARQVARQAERGLALHPGQRIALYAPLGEELDVAPLARAVRRHGGRVYLPRIVNPRTHRMRFVADTGAMRRNRLGILEPQATSFLAAGSLDIVFVPLVGFDASGMRLGMGAGYYDRAFAFVKPRGAWHRPKLIGVGFAAQRVAAIPAEPHDVRLDAVVTEAGVIHCRRDR
jgi:5-formyltetrahydrofolate cyclo-ligase